MSKILMRRIKVQLTELVNEAQKRIRSKERERIYITPGDPADTFVLKRELEVRGVCFQIGARKPTKEEYYIDLREIDLQYQ